MKRESIKELVAETMERIGCPASNLNVSIVPSKLRIEVAVRGERLKLALDCPSGMPESEVRGKLADFAKRYLDCKDQVDLEDAIEDRLPAAAQ